MADDENPQPISFTDGDAMLSIGAIGTHLVDIGQHAGRYLVDLPEVGDDVRVFAFVVVGTRSNVSKMSSLVERTVLETFGGKETDGLPGVPAFRVGTPREGERVLATRQPSTEQPAVPWRGLKGGEP